MCLSMMKRWKIPANLKYKHDFKSFVNWKEFSILKIQYFRYKIFKPCQKREEENQEKSDFVSL